MILRNSAGSVPSTASISDLLEERILNRLQIGVERDNAVAASLVGESDEQRDQIRRSACAAR